MDTVAELAKVTTRAAADLMADGPGADGRAGDGAADGRAGGAWGPGLRGRRVSAGDEARAAFEALRDALAEEWRPRSVTAWLVVDQLARVQWRLLRAGEAEAGRLERLIRQPGVADAPDDAGGRANVALAYDLGRAASSLSRIQLYQMRLERAAHRCVTLLITLRKSRGKLGKGRAAGARGKAG